MSGIERVPISWIVEGERRRKEYGDISGLAKSIDTHGLMHPIIVDENTELIVGGRRLRACQELGWETIDARRWAGLSPAEKREIELAENLNRENLTPYELSRNM